jgi:hypothetical protein
MVLLAGLGVTGDSDGGCVRGSLELKEFVKSQLAISNEKQLGRWALGWKIDGQQEQRKAWGKAAGVGGLPRGTMMQHAQEGQSWCCNAK